MSELITARRADFRWQLLTTVSALALSGVITSSARAEDGDRPTVWIELGGQLEAMGGRPDSFAPPFIVRHLGAPYNAASPIDATRPAQHGFGGEAKLTVQPSGTDWTFSAAVRYGRSNRSTHLHQQTTTGLRQKTWKYSSPIFGHHAFSTRAVSRFDDATAKNSESHAVMDFMAGKDVGLGIFGQESNSTVSLGVRFAQFQSQANTGFKSFPDPHYSTQVIINDPGAHHHTYAATAVLERNFRGVGPSIAWNGSAPFIGHRDAGEVTFDWGANAALLFGRQKTQGHHQTTGRYFHGSPFALPPPATSHYRTPYNIDRSHSVVVPNAGGFAGVSVRYPSLKLSLGYRADFFFGAVDGGIDTRKSVTTGFYGPFATISVGLGG